MNRMDQKSHVRQFFNRNDGWTGKFYTDIQDPYGQMLVRRKQHVLRLFRGHVHHGAANIFDAGCGPGEYLGELGGNGCRVFGMDASEEMVRTSAGKLREERPGEAPALVRGDIEQIPFRSGSFDAVLCIGVLGYLEQDERALRELHRLLRPGGVLLLNVRNLNALTSLHYSVRLKLRYLALHGWSKLRSLVSIATHTRDGGWKSRAYSIRRLEGVVESVGFRRVDGLTFGYELKFLGKLGLNGGVIVAMETRIEKLMMAMPFRVFRNSGWGYVGVFRREARAS